MQISSMDKKIEIIDEDADNIQNMYSNTDYLNLLSN